MPTTLAEVPYCTEQIETLLVGRTIVQAVTSKDGKSFGFVAVDLARPPATRKPDLMVWCDMDAEGNGPGWLNIEEVSP